MERRRYHVEMPQEHGFSFVHRIRFEPQPKTSCDGDRFSIPPLWGARVTQPTFD